MSIRDDLEARNEKRRQIRYKINTLNIRINWLSGLLKSFQTSNKNMKTAKDNLQNEFDRFQAVEINRDVVVVDVFEGELADQISTDLTQVKGYIELSMFKIEQISGEVDVQIVNLQDYIAELQEQVSALYMELAAI